MTEILTEIGAYDADGTNNGVGITTAVKCATGDGTVGLPNLGKPKISEIKKCMPLLGAELALIKPETLIVGLGNYAMVALTGRPLSKCKVSFTHGVYEEIQGRLVGFTVHPKFVVAHKHTAGGRTRDQLTQDLRMAWKAACDRTGEA
jgi:uracil-DNA glycosylase